MDKEDVAHIYNRILLSHQKEWNNAICSHVDGPNNCHTEWSKSDREGEILYGIPYMWNLKRNVVNNLPAMQETQVLSLGQEDPLEKEMATH